MTAGKANRFSSILIVLLGLRRTLARRMGGWAAAAALGMWAPGAFAADAPDPHAECHHHAAPGAARTSAAYAVPDVELVRDDGKTVRLSQELDDGRPVVLSFIFTSCTTVCPMLSATLAQLQRKLGPARDQVHVVSISIDPEFDTPGRLREYARKFGAGPEWQHYGGTLAASRAVQRAFGVYRGEKMNHAPATLVRTRPGAEWVRFDGFATADQLLAELPGVRASLWRHGSRRVQPNRLARGSEGRSCGHAVPSHGMEDWTC